MDLLWSVRADKRLKIGNMLNLVPLFRFLDFWSLLSMWFCNFFFPFFILLILSSVMFFWIRIHLIFAEVGHLMMISSFVIHSLIRCSWLLAMPLPSSLCYSSPFTCLIFWEIFCIKLNCMKLYCMNGSLFWTLCIFTFFYDTSELQIP